MPGQRFRPAKLHRMECRISMNRENALWVERRCRSGENAWDIESFFIDFSRDEKSLIQVFTVRADNHHEESQDEN